MFINLDMLDPKYKSTVENIEKKPHVNYIRYLLLKRKSPAVIKKELQKLQLSTTFENNLVIYYISVIDPLIKAYGVSDIYAEYKGNLLLKTGDKGNRRFSKNVLNYKIDVMGFTDDKKKLRKLEVGFHKLIKELDVSELFASEIYKFYGSAANFPLDPDTGEKILSVTGAYAGFNKILTCLKRHVIDKLIIEGVPDKRIVAFVNERPDFNLRITTNDVIIYRRAFFNLKCSELQDRLSVMSEELSRLEEDYVAMDNQLEGEEDYGESYIQKVELKKKIDGVKETIMALNALHSDYAHKVALSDANNAEGIFLDVFMKSYMRFVSLDKFTDRDIVDPLFKTVKMLGYAHDKLNEVKSGSKSGDKHMAQTAIELIKRRQEEVMAEAVAESNDALKRLGIEPVDPSISSSDIMGMEEMDMNLDVDREEE